MYANMFGENPQKILNIETKLKVLTSFYMTQRLATSIYNFYNNINVEYILHKLTKSKLVIIP